MALLDLAVFGGILAAALHLLCFTGPGPQLGVLTPDRLPDLSHNSTRPSYFFAPKHSPMAFAKGE